MPISDKQLAANRANAKKSTGPKTPAGKAVCAMNGFEHGLTGLAVVMTDEDRITQNEFVGPIIQDLNPMGAMEIQLARSAALDQFRLNRLKAIEENMLAWTELGPLGDKLNTVHARVHHGMTQARAFFNNDRAFNNLSLYEQRITRNVHKNLKLLRELQAQRKAERKEELKEDDRLNAKTQLLTRTASGGSEENGSGFSSAPVKVQAVTQAVTAEAPAISDAPIAPGSPRVPPQVDLDKAA